MNKLQAFGAILALSCLPFCVQANQPTLIEGTYSVNFNDSDPGLQVQIEDLASNPLSMSLTPGSSTTFDLFNIWTNESWVNDDDEIAQPISVDFNFTNPESMNGSVQGTTVGKINYLWIFATSQEGDVSWNGPTDFYFGPNHDGHFQVALSDSVFSKGFYPTGLSDCLKGTVSATVTMLHDASSASVPEPGTFALFGLGLLGMIVGARRRRSRG